jgi:LysR family glycine cleavage system transcriptional activator
MALRLPPLAPLRLFEAAGRHCSFKLAAQELGVTPSAVSHGIDSLEDWLGVKLSERGPRGLSLTAAGKDYLPYVSEALSSIAIATQRLPDRRSAWDISISCTPTFASRLLIPALRHFQEQHPKFTVSLDSSHRHVGFPVDGFDLAIRMGRRPWPGLHSEKLLTEHLVPVCTPACLADLPAPGSSRFFGATLLHVTSVTEDWATWLEGAGIEGIDLAKGLRFDGIQLAFDAAKEGLGIAIGRRPLIDPELARGELVPAAELTVESAVGYWLVSSQAVEDRAPAGILRRWLVEHMTPPAQQAGQKLTRG